MADLRKQIAGNKNYHFDFQMGAAELEGGKDASYDDVLGSEMNATKAAIMARDTSFKLEVVTDNYEEYSLIALRLRQAVELLEAGT